MKFDFPYEMKHVTSYRATLSEPVVIGPVAEGLRINIPITGGELFGPKIKGTIGSVGADWLTIRTDGVAILDVRTTFETHDGALIYTYYTGTADLGPNGHQNFLDGLPPPAEGIPLRTRPIYQTSHPDYLWLNRTFCVGIGRVLLDKGQVEYDVYSLG